MKKSITLILLSFLFSVDELIAQIKKDSLDQFLQDYARPDFKRVALDLRPRLAGLVTNDSPGFVFKSNNIQFTLGSNYNYVRNSERWQSFASITLNMQVLSVEDVGSEFGLKPAFAASNRYFFKPKTYIALHNGGNGSYVSGNASTNPDAIDQVYSYNNVGIGFGRIELVSDAIHVARVVDLLRSAGVLSKEVSIRDLEEIVDTVAVMKNRRFFDSRLQRIREMEAISQLLYDMGYLGDLDFHTYAVLSDAYDFEVPYRSFQSGSAFEILVGRDFFYSEQGWGSADDLRLRVGWENNKVRSQYVGTRFRVGSSLSYRYAAELLGGQQRYTSRSYIAYAINYAPTNRVVLSWENSGDFSYDLRDRELAESTTRKGMSAISNVSLNYYFSPQLRFSGSVIGLISNYDLGEVTPSRELRFGASLLYSYF